VIGAGVILALSSAVETAWWVSLAVGLVVALVVWFLLEWLRRTVKEVDRAVDEVWVMGKRVAQNTSTTYMLGGTKELGVELLEEVKRHGELAERRKG
jgi:type II secretory pathway component PulF